MAKFQQVITTLALSFHLVGCQTPSFIRGFDSSSVAEVPNPMPDIWAAVRNEIDMLERTGAPLLKWKEACGSSEQISTVLRLHEITKPVRLESEQERTELDQLFSSNPDTYHFGFEGNFHALVFFDASHRPIKVVKW